MDTGRPALMGVPKREPEKTVERPYPYNGVYYKKHDCGTHECEGWVYTEQCAVRAVSWVFHNGEEVTRLEIIHKGYEYVWRWEQFYMPKTIAYLAAKMAEEIIVNGNGTRD